ncbi:hypothetical protein CYMTET_8235 [Cymbomonas tetramitiformis]|uniref:P53 and DNA damage-regulated protein 1 n=1 Tax=Cymbomonas tetramitiformis TaxID=36881 RepID=A0AAE0GTL8_9CHLO|nr:hypothetical protein CYMTET_8235 [Cymbomonas tetramitiformis]
MEELQQAVSEVERLGEEFLTAKAQVVECDRARNANREALTAIRKKGGGESELGCFGSTSKGFLLRPGGVFIRLSNEQATSILQRDQARLDEEVQKSRQDMKIITRSLHEKGGTPSHLSPGLLNAMITLKDDGRMLEEET